MAFDTNIEAIRADVVFNAVTGKSVEEIENLRTKYLETVGSMDTKALKASAAQDRLTKALANSAAGSLRAKTAVIRYQEEMARLDGQLGHTSGDLTKTEHSTERFGRGLLVGSGILGNFRRAVFLASGSLLGGFGLTYAIRSTVEAAERQQVALGHIQVALKDAGLAYSRYSRQIQDGLNAQIKATGFTNTELADSLAMFIRRYGDVNQALRANAAAADVARAKNVDLATAQQLVMRAGFGNPRSLRILGIELQKTTTNYDQLVASNKHATVEEKNAAKAADLHANELAALDAVQKRYGGNAARYLQTTAGKQALFNAELEQTKEIIGGALLPTLNHLLGSLTSWLGKTQNQARIQRDANEVVRDLGIAGHVAAAGLHLLEGVLGPVNKLLGGTKHSVELLTAALIAFKARGVIAFLTGSAEMTGAGALGRLGLGAAAGEAGSVAIGAPELLAGAAGLYGGYRLGQYLGGVIKGKPTSFKSLPKGYRTDLGMNILQPGGALFNLEHGAGLGAGAVHHQAGKPFTPAAHHTGPVGHFTDVVPSSLQLQYARAQLSGNVTGQRAALGSIHSFFEHQLALATTDQQRLDITQQLLTVQSELDTLSSHSAAAAHKRTASQLRAQSAAFRHQESGFRARELRLAGSRTTGGAALTITGSRTGISGLVTGRGRLHQLPGGRAHLAAGGSSSISPEEAAAYRAEARYLQTIIRDRHEARTIRDEARVRLASIEKNIGTIAKNTSQSAAAKEAQAFLETLSGEIRQYAPNVQQTMTFHRGPEDPHAAAKHMRRAALAAFN